MSLLDRIKKAREVKVPVGGFTFLVRRPSELEMLELKRSGITERKLLDFVVGWEGVKESDLINGGDPHPLAFDSAACCLWLEDRADLLGPVVSQVIQSFQDHAAQRQAAEKN